MQTKQEWTGRIQMRMREKPVAVTETLGAAA
jgi:hypothetical protein